MDASSSSSFPGTSSFVILSVSIVGILAFSLLLLAYYLFLTRCDLLFFWRPDLQRHMPGHHHHHHHHQPRLSVSLVTVVQEQPRGLDESAIRRIPTFRYRQQQATAEECAVCLADFRDGERLRLLPPCLHAFHIDCIDAWLQAAANCPLCRAAVVHHATDGDDIVVVIDSSAADQPAPAPAAAGPGPSETPSNERRFLPMRRSLSMDSTTDKRFYLAPQRTLQHHQPPAAAAREEDKGSSRRLLRRSFFSFSQTRGSSRTAVLPI